MGIKSYCGTSLHNSTLIHAVCLCDSVPHGYLCNTLKLYQSLEGMNLVARCFGHHKC